MYINGRFQAMMCICSGPNFKHYILKDHCPKGLSIPCREMAWHDMVFTCQASPSPAEKWHGMTWCSHGPNIEHSRDTFFSLFHHPFKIANKSLESTPLVGTSIDPVTHFRHLETISQNSQTIRHTKNTGHE